MAMMVRPERRALVAEDSVLVLLGLEFELRQQGVEIVGSASTVAQALVLATTAVFDIAILDINLHGEMVFPVADLLRQRDIPVIFTTGYDPKQMLPPEYAGVPCLQKPYDPRALMRLVTQTLMPVKAHDTAMVGKNLLT
jgi:CheY-like chemotaxis protein